MRATFYVIADPCIGVKDRSCVAACPCDCIHGTDNDPQLFINPDECIGCGLCQTECPVGAIFSEEELPEKWQASLTRNAKHFAK